MTALTLWAYSRRLKGSAGRWVYVAVTLRLLALLLCLLAALRPSVFLNEKKKQNASVVVLVDVSTSMNIGDEVRGQTRWDVAKEAVKQARDFAKTLGPDLDLKFYRFDSKLAEPKTGESVEEAKPAGRETDLGSGMQEAQKKTESTSRRLARLVILSDFANNHGSDPLEAARRLKGQGVPVVTVGLGTENAGAVHRDIKLRDIAAGPTVFVKNNLQVRGNIVAKGYSGQTLLVELFVEGRATPVAKTSVKVPDGTDVIPITGLTYTPAYAWRETGHAQGRQAGRRAGRHEQRDQYVRDGFERRFECLFSAGLQLHLGLPVSDEGHREVPRYPGRGVGDPSSPPG